MCGRFTMTRRDRSELAAMLGVHENELGDYVPRFNIAPTQPYFVLKTKYESREAIPAIWGLVNSWATDASRASMCINAKAETVDKIPSFREAFEKRRRWVLRMRRPHGQARAAMDSSGRRRP